MTTTVSKKAGPERFEISVDGQKAGEALFVDTEGRRVFFHTEVDPTYSGQGLGGALVSGALEATRAEGLRVVAVCPFVKKYVNTHEEWAAEVDAATPAMLAAIPRR